MTSPNRHPLVETASLYWRTYGGWRALIYSPFIWTSLLITVALGRYVSDRKWVDPSFNILPSLLGFSIGAMAIVLALPSTKLFTIISERGYEKSYYMELASRLLHFIIIQVIGIMFSVITVMTEFSIFAFLGFFFLCYAILTGVAVGFSIFDLAEIYNYSASINNERSGGVGSEPAKNGDGTSS